LIDEERYMKKTAAILLVLFSVFNGISYGDVCSAMSDDVIKKHADLESFTVVSKREVNGLCEIIVNSGNSLIPFYGAGKFIISGEMYENGRALTSDKIYEINMQRFREAKKEVDALVAFTYTPAKVKIETSLYMFTDPLCPYCNKIGADVISLSERLGFRIKVLLYTVHGERGKEKCIEAACRSMDGGSFNLPGYYEQEWKKKETEKAFLCIKGEALVAKTEALSEIIGVDSVPFFFIDDGNYVSGASMEEVEALFGDKQ